MRTSGGILPAGGSGGRPPPDDPPGLRLRVGLPHGPRATGAGLGQAAEIHDHFQKRGAGVVALERFDNARRERFEQQVQVIDDPNPTDANTGFGSALAASTDLLMVGARSTTLAGNIGQGMVYPYRLNNGTWSPEGKLSDAHGSARQGGGQEAQLRQWR